MAAREPKPVRRRALARLVGAFAACLVLTWQGPARAQEMQVIELRYRLADDLIPTLQPLLEPGGVLTGMDGMLFVRASAANVEQIRQATALLDRKPRQLLISVGQGTVASVQDADVRGAATIGSGDVQVGVNRPPVGDPGVAIRAGQRTQNANLHNVSRIRTLEGSETFVAIGQSAPVSTTQVTPGWGRPNVVQTTEFRSASTGFYATAHLSGDRVTLDLAPQQQRFSGPEARRTVESAGLTTRVSGRLGEWIGVGGASESGSSTTAGLLVWGRRSSDSQYTVWVKVEEAP
jgi:type II secretory pathway component GspD/PulD (secretin)